MQALSKEDLNSSVWDSPELISSRKGDVGFSDNVFRQNVGRQNQNKQPLRIRACYTLGKSKSKRWKVKSRKVGRTDSGALMVDFAAFYLHTVLLFTLIP